jgi:hypothetical protein
VYDCAGATLAGLAVTDIDLLRFAQGNNLQLAAMALRYSFHPDPL